jgi:hypothetical protein
MQFPAFSKNIRDLASHHQLQLEAYNTYTCISVFMKPHVRGEHDIRFDKPATLFATPLPFKAARVRECWLGEAKETRD